VFVASVDPVPLSEELDVSVSKQELVSANGGRAAETRRSEATRVRGNKDVEEFYDSVGWREQSGQTGDAELFWPPVPGPLRAVMDQQRQARVRSALREAGPRLSLVEAGCGGNPAAFLLPLCARYTGVDFSEAGLELARKKLSSHDAPFDLARSDVCSLPFPDGSFDAAYSAHVFYHIDDVAAQAKACTEICRVVRPGGRVALILANPRPLLFPVRMLRRMVADTPILSDVVRRLRRPGRLPYLPMTLRWMRRQLSPFGAVRMSCHALEPVWLSQRISESTRFGRALLRVMTGAERMAPKQLVRLGNYVLITVARGG